jgi:hypothetical protein
MLLQTYNVDTIREVIEKLEELREMNKQLRENAQYYEGEYKRLLFGTPTFNPETLPK